MNQYHKIARTSRCYVVLLTILLVLVPVAHGAVWLFFEHLPADWLRPRSYAIVGGVSPLTRVLGFAVSMIKGIVVMYGLWVLIRLFKLYQKGIFFQAENVRCFKHLSRTLVLWAFAGVLVTPLLSVVLTMNNPPGQRVVEVTLQSADLTALVVGGMLAVIAAVMEDGERLQTEVDLTV
ncbi:DUF2975 domain-containing protein [Desulfofustis glycolicus]|uniref:DUF2975 domain-containing protein n=1 Tax=Desulfofustis glycolicus DSM 9705 TaxID=1121409 RepID=A0A1M5VYA4_9BACT|nr:DUF2975 domain-containing protein [Desulfofustis glycolicus]MCB2215185.1 DUF2975 domain-containing protein [Desulfobulbaceae bacterium]SHH80216.1 Protein of unknown function [Desulfofustis glycolicus DSM 9705]